MSGTPAWLRRRVAEYYEETTRDSYLVWAGAALGLHLGLDAEAGDAPSAGLREALDRSILAMNALLADRASIGAGTRVFDAGCGVGGSSIWLAKERGARVVGMTIEPGQVELARRFARERGVESFVEIERGDFAAAGRPNGSFDVVWNLESLCHVHDAGAYLQSARELLAEGGRFVCADFFRGRGGRDCDAMCEGWVLPALRSPSEIAFALERAGFAEVEVLDLRPRVLAAARVMCSMAFHEIVGIEAAARSGRPPSSSYRRHFDASIAACTGLESGEIAYALVSARRPMTARA